MSRDFTNTPRLVYLLSFQALIDSSPTVIDHFVLVEEKKPTRILERHSQRFREPARALHGDIVFVGIVGRETYIAPDFVCARLLRGDLECRADDTGQRYSRCTQIVIEAVCFVLDPHHRAVGELSGQPSLRIRRLHILLQSMKQIEFHQGERHHGRDERLCTARDIDRIVADIARLHRVERTL